MRIAKLLFAILFLLIPAFASEPKNVDSNDQPESVAIRDRRPDWTTAIPVNKNTKKELQESKIMKKDRKKKNLERKETLARQREVLMELREQLKAKGLETEFLDKIFEPDQKLRIRLGERLIKRAKKKIARAVKRGIKIRNERKRDRKVMKSANLMSGMSNPGIKSSINRAYSRGQVRGSLNQCPTGQTRIRGRCKCPYLSEWNANQQICDCIYGTYRDNQGNCRNHF